MSSLVLLVAVIQLKSSNQQFYTSNKGLVLFNMKGGANIAPPNVAMNTTETSAENLTFNGDFENVGHAAVEVIFERFFVADNTNSLVEVDNYVEKFILAPGETSVNFTGCRSLSKP